MSHMMSRGGARSRKVRKPKNACSRCGLGIVVSDAVARVEGRPPSEWDVAYHKKICSPPEIIARRVASPEELERIRNGLSLGTAWRRVDDAKQDDVEAQEASR